MAPARAITEVSPSSPAQLALVRSQLVDRLVYLDAEARIEKLATCCKIVDTHALAWDTFKLHSDVTSTIEAAQPADILALQMSHRLGFYARRSFVRLTCTLGEISRCDLEYSFAELDRIEHEMDFLLCAFYSALALGSLSKREPSTLLFDYARRLETRIQIARPHSNESSENRARCLLALAEAHLSLGRHEECGRIAIDLEPCIGTDSRLRLDIHRLKLRLALSRNAVHDAKRLIDSGLPAAASTTLQQAELRRLEAEFFLRVGDYFQAETYAREARSLASETLAPKHEKPKIELTVGLALSAQRKHLEASYSFAAALTCSASSTRYVLDEYVQLASTAHFLESNDRESALKTMRVVLARHPRHVAVGLIAEVPEVASLICDEALASDVASDLVKAAIQAQELVAPDELSGWWPWSLSARFLGGRSVMRTVGTSTDVALDPESKLCDILQVLVAAHPDPVPLRVLTNVIGEMSSDAISGKAVEIAIHRLRRQLHPGVIEVASGLVRLDTSLIWTDVNALRIAHIRSAGVSNATFDQVNRLAQQTLDLYRGNLTGQDQHSLLRRAQWLAQTRFEEVMARCIDRLSQMGAGAIAERYRECALALRPQASVLRTISLETPVHTG